MVQASTYGVVSGPETDDPYHCVGRVAGQAYWAVIDLVANLGAESSVTGTGELLRVTGGTSRNLASASRFPVWDLER